MTSGRTPDTKRRRKLTPKQRVLRQWPDAFCAPGFGFYAGLYVIKDMAISSNVYSNHARTPRGAWAAAARNL